MEEEEEEEEEETGVHEEVQTDEVKGPEKKFREISPFYSGKKWVEEEFGIRKFWGTRICLGPRTVGRGKNPIRWSRLGK